MFDTKAIATKHKVFYKALLSFYPENYRKHFGQEMLIIFDDIYQEELAKSGKIPVGFWLSIVIDTAKSASMQHMDMIKKLGLKKYFHINLYNSIGLLLLLPFITLVGIDFLGRLVQGDLMHYNRVWYSFMSRTILYSTINGRAYFLWIALVLAPIVAVVLNLIPLVQSLIHSKKTTVKTLFFTNPLAIAIMVIGIFALLVIYGHDFFPCVVHGLLNGSVNKEQIVSICANA